MIYTGTRLAYAPIGTFLIYQIFRFVFWKNYKNEFIPFSLGRNYNKLSFDTMFKMHLDRFVSKTEKRGGHKEDKKYMKMLVWLGVIFIFYCLWGLIGLKAK
ncbi:MAG: hypothetical protein EOP00_15625 [Pedobacter sp.]|nr:MAG: hypothetical protein EOP00_15625 [Pedobacter sp.]